MQVPTARRAAEIEPFEVMDVLSRAHALEAQGRRVVHMEIGEPDFTAPAPVVDALNKEIKTMLEREDVKKTIATMGARTDWGTPQQFSDFVSAETVKFAEIIKREGLQMDVN